MLNFAENLIFMLHDFFNNYKLIKCKSKLIDLSEPKVMGIVNITPDSFYSKSRFVGKDEVSARVKQILNEGGDIIDIGAYSSRPGASHIEESEEWNRLEPVLEVIRNKFPDAVISVDTFRSKIAEKAVVKFNVDIINDISAGNMDVDMFETIASLQVPYIMMHMLGTPQNMQQNPSYDHLIKEIFMFFAERVDNLSKLGISDIIIDPGFGFGKTWNHNYEILAKLDEFKIFELPILVGISRKSMIYKYLNTVPENALNGTTVLNTQAIMNGANILRVHDVKEAVEVVKLTEQLKVNASGIYTNRLL